MSIVVAELEKLNDPLARWLINEASLLDKPHEAIEFESHQILHNAFRYDAAHRRMRKWP
jgi:hypothetical protein